MTLVLTYVNPVYALQISDRLVTDPNSHGPLDPSANKAIVFLASNALVTLAYAGTAVVDFKKGSAERATDQWIVEQLAGASSLEAAMNLGTPKYKLDLGYALKAVCHAMNADERFAAGQTEIAYAGFQWKRPRAHARSMRVTQIMGSISPTDGRYEAVLNVYRRGQPTWAGTITIPDTPALDNDRLADELSKCTESDADVVEAILVDAIRRAAESSDESVIGTDCMSVMIADGSVRIRYDGVRPTIGPAALPATPTPWIVTPGTIYAPLTVYWSEHRVGGLPVHVDVPPSEVPSETVGGARLGHIRKRMLIPIAEAQQREFGVKPPKIPPPPIHEDNN